MQFLHYDEGTTRFIQRYLQKGEEEQCGGRTYLCEEGKRYVCLKDKETHMVSGQCDEFKAENKHKEQLEQ